MIERWQLWAGKDSITTEQQSCLYPIILRIDLKSEYTNFSFFSKDAKLQKHFISPYTTMC